MGKIIKVLLAIRPQLLAEVVRHFVTQQPDMVVVGEVADPNNFLLAIGVTEAEVVIMTSADLDREVWRDLWAVYPQLRIMVLSVDGDTAVLYESGSRQKYINDVGEASILSVLHEFKH